MKDFWYYVPTRVNFGPSCFQYLVDTIHQWGTKPLIVYGGGSIKRNGAYDAVVSRLKEANIPYAEMGGVAPNPRYESVLEGNRICREELCDILLPVSTREALEAAVQNEAAVTELSRRYQVVGIHMFWPSLERGETAHCRNFAPLYAIPEEAATGTSNGALTYYLYRQGKLRPGDESRFLQGEHMGKPSEILSRLEEGDGSVKIRVGGRAVLTLGLELL